MADIASVGPVLVGDASPPHAARLQEIIRASPESSEALLAQAILGSGARLTPQVNWALTKIVEWIDELFGLRGVVRIYNKTVAVGGILKSDLTRHEVVNTTLETVVFSFSVPANTLGTDRALRLTLIGDYLNNSGATPDANVYVRYGQTIICRHFISAVAASSVRRSYGMQLLLSATASTQAQCSMAFGSLGPTTGSSATGLVGTPFHHGVGVRNVIAEDSTVDKLLTVAFKHSTAASTVSMRSFAIHVELL